MVAFTKHDHSRVAAEMLRRLQGDPDNSSLLIQIGNLYKGTHQFKGAAEYYGKAVKIDSKNVAIRTEMASCQFTLTVKRYAGSIPCHLRL
jgi:cytochrome c-type biogenesis protein CcmH/NrfG